MKRLFVFALMSASACLTADLALTPPMGWNSWNKFADKIDDKNPNFGGWGYSAKKGRADGSNLQMALEALHDSGLPQDDPAYKSALKFLQRQQNLSETNDQPWASNDGGFIYTPGNNGESMAGDWRRGPKVAPTDPTG